MFYEILKRLQSLSLIHIAVESILIEPNIKLLVTHEEVRYYLKNHEIMQCFDVTIKIHCESTRYLKN